MPISQLKNLSLFALIGIFLSLIFVSPARALDSALESLAQERALQQEQAMLSRGELKGPSAPNYVLTNVTGRDFHGQDLSKSSFAGAVARDADFSNANLHGTTLTRVDFLGANLQGVDLTDTLADRANFQKTNLKNAVLTNMIAMGSSFAGAEIEGADFSYAVLDSDDQSRLCLEAEGTNPITGISTRDSLEC